MHYQGGKPPKLKDWPCDNLTIDEVWDFLDDFFFETEGGFLTVEDEDGAIQAWTDDYDYPTLLLPDGTRYALAFPESWFPCSDEFLDEFREIEVHKLWAHQYRFIDDEDEDFHRILLRVDNCDLTCAFCTVCGLVDLTKEPLDPKIEEKEFDLKWKRFNDLRGKKTDRRRQ